MQSALARALGAWPRQGIPRNPAAWLHRVAANLALDALRRDTRWGNLDEIPDLESSIVPVPFADECEVGDAMLRMMFVCCDPAVPAGITDRIGIKNPLRIQQSGRLLVRY